MLLRKVHEPTFLWFGLPGPLLIIFVQDLFPKDVPGESSDHLRLSRCNAAAQLAASLLFLVKGIE